MANDFAERIYVFTPFKRLSPCSTSNSLTRDQNFGLKNDTFDDTSEISVNDWMIMDVARLNSVASG